MKRLLMIPLFMGIMVASAQLPQDYRMAGPYEIVARDGEHRRTKGGSERDMYTAWQLAQKGDAEQALNIINAYAQTLQGYQ